MTLGNFNSQPGMNFASSPEQRRAAAIAAARRRASLIPDHQFNSGSIGDWVSSRGTTTLAIVSGALEITQAGSNDGASLPLSLPAGIYHLAADVANIDGGVFVRFGVHTAQSLTGAQFVASDTAPWTADVTFEITSPTTWFGVLNSSSAGKICAIDNIVLRKIS